MPKEASSVTASDRFSEEIEDLFREDNPRAKYCIEVLFGKGRTLHGPNKAVVTVWRAGKSIKMGYNHDMFDVLLSQCETTDGNKRDNAKQHFGKPVKTKKEDIMGCGKFFETSAHPVVCPHCGRYWGDGSTLTTERYVISTSRNLAKLLSKLWRILGGDVDLYLKSADIDIRPLALGSQEQLDMARTHKNLIIYPIKHIIKDTATGLSLEDAFFKAITA